MVSLGGAVGSLARYITGTAVMARFRTQFPLGTLFINVTGSFLIGLLMTFLTERWRPHPNWRLVLVVGFLGGYTTFSSFEYESYRAIRDGGPWLGLLNIVGSVALGYVAVWTGALIAGHR
jgi:CrcB protein